MAKRPDKTGRSGYERHVRLPHLMTGSAAWRDLSGNAIKVYIALSRFNVGDNNGRLYFGVETGVAETGLSRGTVRRALRDLEEHGFIDAVERGYFRQKGGPATSWRLTHLPAPGCKPAIPTHDWQRWETAKGNKTRGQNLTSTGPIFGRETETPPATGSKFDHGKRETPHVSVGAVRPNFDPQLVSHGLGVSQVGNSAGKHAQSAPPDSGGPISRELIDGLRARAAEWIKAGGIGAQTRLAVSADIPGGTLSKFLAGRGLSVPHFVALQFELARNPSERVAA